MTRAVSSHPSASVALAASPVVLAKITAEPSRTSAEIVRLGRIPLPKLRQSIRKDVADLFWATFDGASVNAKCDDAVQKIPGVSADTFARIAARETDKIDLALVQVMLALHFAKSGSVAAFPGLTMRAAK